MTDEPKTLINAVRYYADLHICNDLMRKIKWPDGKTTCPHCEGRRIAESADGKRLQCRDCRTKFSATSGTIFADSRRLDAWFIAVWCEANGVTVTTERLAELLGITQRTAWQIRANVRNAMRMQGHARKERHEKISPAA